jgi:hypothetical protein
MSAKAEKKPKKEKTPSRRFYNGSMKKIMKTTLMLHASEGHEDRKTPGCIEP